MIYIVIPVFNRVKLTVACLQSLRQQSFRDFRTIVVDDGSTDGSFEILQKEFPELLLVRGDGNLWWAGATNAGVKKALELSDSSTDYVLTLNNDLTVKPDYLQRLLDVANQDPSFVVGSLSVSDTNEHKVDFCGLRWNKKTGKYSYPQRAYQIDELKSKLYMETDMLPGRGVLIPVQVFEKIGLYDEKNFPQYMADDDFSLRCTYVGYKLVVATRAVVYANLGATGLNHAIVRRDLSKFVESLGSIRSSNNLKIRYKFARKHAAVPMVYSLLDTGRVLFSFFKKAR